jgi:serine protease Do
MNNAECKMKNVKCKVQNEEWDCRPPSSILHFTFYIIHFALRRPARSAARLRPALLAAALLFWPAPLWSQGTGDPADAEQAAFQAAVDRVAPSVVRIETVGGMDRVGRVLVGTGPTTGLVLTPDGYVVSSAFNFMNRPASILVQLPDGGHHPAQLVATDRNRMLVLLKIDPAKPLPVPEIAPPGEVRVGQWAIAVGRTFELSRPNMAVGVVSATNRIWGKAIQTDAAVSPNNYGGPLVDIRGRLLGVLVPLSPTATTELAGVEWYDSGIGFAIPGQAVMDLLPRLKQGKDLLPGVVGINIPAQQLFTGEPLLAAVRPRSPAYQAGLRAGDRVVEVDGAKIALCAQLKQELSRRYAGDKIRIAVVRDGKRIERQLELVARLEPYEHPFLGILPMRSAAGSGEKKATGVAVRCVYPDGPAAKSGLQRGDVIASLGGKPIPDARRLRSRVAEFAPDDAVEIEFRRGTATRKATLKLASVPEGMPPADLPPPHEPLKPPEKKPSAAGRIELKSAGSAQPAWAYVPEGFRPEVAHGLVVWLADASGVDEKDVLARWRPLCDRHELILLVPRAVDPKRWQPGDLRGVAMLLAEMTSKYSVDATRVVVCGRDSGGTAALALGLGANSPFRGVVVVDGTLPGPPPENDPAVRRAFYIAASQRSPAARQLKGAVARLRAMKYPVTVKDLGPEPRDLTAEELAEVARWADALDRI